MTPQKIKFHDLLLGFSEESNSNERKILEETIGREYGRENTVLGLEMAGFSLRTRK